MTLEFERLRESLRLPPQDIEEALYYLLSKKINPHLNRDSTQEDAYYCLVYLGVQDAVLQIWTRKSKELDPAERTRWAMECMGFVGFTRDEMTKEALERARDAYYLEGGLTPGSSTSAQLESPQMEPDITSLNVLLLALISQYPQLPTYQQFREDSQKKRDANIPFGPKG